MIKDIAMIICFYGAIFAAVLLPIIGLCYIGESISCEKKWAESGMTSDYGFWTDCRVQLPTGEWIPADRYRAVD